MAKSCNSEQFVNHSDNKNIESEEEHSRLFVIMDLFTNCVMANLLGVFGIFGNIINIAVLRQHGFRESTNIVLCALSVSDLAFSIILPLSKICYIVRYFDQVLAITLETFGIVFLYLPTFISVGNSFALVAVIAVERFTAVYFPFQVSRIFSTRAMTIIVVTIATFSVAVVSPNFPVFQYEWIFDDRYNHTVAVVKSSHYYTVNKEILDNYTWVLLNNAFCTVTMLIVLFCCAAIGVKLSRATIKREKMTSLAKGYDVRVVKMLVGVCVVYLFVQIPTITLYNYLKPDYVNVNLTTKMAIDITEVLFGINASVNFLIYVSMSEKFAKTYSKLLGLEGTRPKPKSSVSKISSRRTLRN